MNSSRLTVLGLVALSIMACVHVGCGGDDASAPSPSGGGGTNDGGAGTDADTGDATTAETGVAVSGKVVWDSVYVKGAVVVIDGKAATTTDNGSFSIPNVKPPYTVHVVVPKELAIPNGPPAKAAAVTTYAGLTTTSPVLTVPAKSNSVVGRVKGVIAGGTNDFKSTYFVTAGAPLAGYALQTGDTSGGSSNLASKSYQISQAWNVGETQQIVSVAAVEFKYPEGLNAFEGIPTTYTSTAKSTVAMTAGATTDGNLGTFAAVSTVKIAGSITVPNGYTVARHALSLLGNGGSSLGFSQDLATTQFEYPVPNDTAAFPKIRIGATATTSIPGQYASAWVDVAPGTQGIVLAIPTGPSIDAPANGAAGVKPGDILSWTSAGDTCLYEVRLTSNNDVATSFTLRTTATRVTVPDLVAQGGALAASSTYTFSVECDVLDGTTKASLDADAVLGRAPSHAYAGAPNRTFITQ